MKLAELFENHARKFGAEIRLGHDSHGGAQAA